MLIVDLEGLCLVLSIARDSHYPHPCKIVSRIYTEILRLVVLLNDEVVHPSYCLHKIGQSPSIVRRSLIHELVVDQGPDAFILMHVRPDVKIDQSLALVWRGEPLIQIRHVPHGVPAVRVHLRTHDGIVRSHDRELIREILTSLYEFLLDGGLHGTVVLGCGHLVDLKEGIEEDKGQSISEAVCLDSLVDFICS